MEIFDSGSSQNSDLGQEQLNNMEESAKADNTKRATEWGLNHLSAGPIPHNSIHLLIITTDFVALY